MGVRRHLAALLAPLLLLVVACGAEDPKPKIAPSPSAPVSSASPAEPVISASPVVVEPEAVVRRWVELSNKMQISGDTTQYREITKNCESCARVAAQIEGFYAAGGFVRTNGWTITGLRALGVPTEQTDYILRVNSAPTTYATAAGEPEQSLDGGDFRFRVSLELLDGAWTVFDYVDLG